MSNISNPISRRSMLAATAVVGVLPAGTLAHAAEAMPEPRRSGHGGSVPYWRDARLLEPSGLLRLKTARPAGILGLAFSPAYKKYG